MKNFTALLGFLVSTSVLAEVPHTFIAGAPARADEVNANFSSLDSEISTNTGAISTIKAKVETLEKNQAIAPTCYQDDWAAPSSNEVTYEAKLVDLGTKVEEDYRIIEVAFVEYGSGDKYKIKLPVETINNSRGLINQDKPIEILHSNDSITCSNLSVSNYSAKGVIEEKRVLELTLGRGHSDSIELHFNLSIKVGETLISIPLNRRFTRNIANIANDNIPPVANIILPPTIEVALGEHLVFDASASSDEDGTITKYIWDGVEGTSSYSISFDTIGSKNVFLEVVDNEGKSAWVRLDIRVATSGVKDIKVTKGSPLDYSGSLENTNIINVHSNDYHEAFIETINNLIDYIEIRKVD